MEVVRKIKISKKRRRHRRSNDNKKEEPLEEIKNLYKENCENNQSPKNNKNLNASTGKKNEIIQTDDSTYCDIVSEKDEQIKNLTEKLQQLSSKLYESKNAYTSLKQDFNKAQKLLCSEVGENVTVSGLASQQGWRGRAEQIQQLQQKIAELQVKQPENDRRKSLDRRSSSSARIFDRERKQHIENLSKDLKETETLLESTKKKLEAARARIAVLENDVNKSKRTISLLNEKTTNDKLIIDALNEQLKSAENKFQDREIGVRKQNEKYEREIVLLKSEIEAVEIHLKNYKRQLDERDKEIELLRCRNGIIIDRLNIPPTPSTLLEDSPRSSIRDANEYIAMGMAAEVEKDRLLELITVLNRRLDKERFEFEQLSNLYKKERSRSAKLETKLQKMELERAGLARVNSGTYRSKVKFIPNDNPNDAEDMRLRLELLEEESLTLKTRLATIQKEKASDLATFRKIVHAYKDKLSSRGCHSSIRKQKDESTLFETNSYFHP